MRAVSGLHALSQHHTGEAHRARYRHRAGVTAAGGQPVAASPGERSVQTTWEQIREAGPEVAVVAPCGFHLDGAAAQAEAVAKHLPGIPVWAIDADGLIVRPGPRLIDGVEALAALLHPGHADAVAVDHIRRVA